MVSGFSTWMQIWVNGERLIFITTMTTGYPHKKNEAEPLSPYTKINEKRSKTKSKR